MHRSRATDTVHVNTSRTLTGLPLLSVFKQTARPPGRIALLVLLTAACETMGGEFKNLTALEIQNLLAGNTAVGAWDGRSYRQYFAEDGSTIYAQQGSRSSLGKWRVNIDKNLYESWWENAHWSGYGVSKEGEQHYWLTLSGTLPPQAFNVLPGNQLEAISK